MIQTFRPPPRRPFLLVLLVAALALFPLSPAASWAEEPVPVRWLPPIASGLDILARFEAPTHEYGPGHRGLDLAAQPGASVSAPAGGVVTFAGRVAGRGVVSVRVDERITYSLEPVDADQTEPSKGDRVGLGAKLGTVGEGGHCVEACVHLGVRVDNIYVDPARYFFTRPVLLPW